ncbi:MAG TPA: cardiolipin synthase [Thermoanaerobaculia bacterium]|nr:cardiolipin synthase [Thermoanaerobaculia bacterium]
MGALEVKTHHMRIPVVVFVAMIFVIAAMTTLLWSMWREPQTHLAVKNPGDLNALLPSIVGVTQASLDGGNRAEVLENGDQFFPRLIADINQAKESVHLESYIWWRGNVCDQLALALANAAHRGVEVRVLVDASGGHKMTKQNEALMGREGVKLASFHPIGFKNLGRLNNRDHRKLAIIDGRIGYIGGYGIADEWSGHAQDKDHWRDTGLRIVGPTVNRMQGAFCENWIEQTGEILAGEKYFPHTAPAGTTQAHLAYTSPTGSISSVQVLYYLAIEAARHEIVIQNPYLLPDENSIMAIRDAVRRGVIVRIMVPATSTTDSPIVQHASHHQFGTLLKAGAHVYEYGKTLLHQKVIIVDGVWSCLGSTNFDSRSFNLNDEISIATLDPRIAAQLHGAFNDDLRYSRERHLAEWSNRPFWHKAIDGLAYLAHGEL